MILSDRDQFVGVHFTKEVKEGMKTAATRRRMSLSAFLAKIAEDWLEKASDEIEEVGRSNKRNEQSHIRVLLRSIPGHQHSIDAQGRPTCGCHYEEDVPLPLTGNAATT